MPLHSPCVFPRDLRVWLRHSALLRAAQGLAQDSDPAALRPVFLTREGRFHHPWRLLTLVTYAHAIGVSDPRLIAALAAVKPDLRELCRGQAPGAATVRRFCNHNRNAIVGCLGKLIGHVWCHEHGERRGLLPPLLIVEILCEARSRVQFPGMTGTKERVSFAVDPQGDETTHARV